MEINWRRGRWAPHTQTLYEDCWRDWLTWCGENRLEPMPAAPSDVADFILDRAARLSTSSIQLRLQAIVNAHKIVKQTAKTAEERERFTIDTKHPLIADAWTEIKRDKGTAGTPKEALTPADVQAMVAKMPEGHTQDRAILLLAFASAMRRSEIAALNVEDLDIGPDGMVITIRRSKTDKSGKGEQVAVARTGTDVCPVAAMETWLGNAAGQRGPVFISGRRNRMNPRRVADIVKLYGGRIGLDKARISGHSTRRGCITTIHEAGVDLRAGMLHSRHRTPAIYLGYVQKKAAQDNPAVKRLAMVLGGASDAAHS